MSEERGASGMSKIIEVSYDARDDSISVKFDDSGECWSIEEFRDGTHTKQAIRELQRVISDAVAKFNEELRP